MRSNARKSKQQPTVTHRARKVVKCLQRILLIKWSGLPGSLACCVGLLAVIKSCRPSSCEHIGHDSECRRYRSELFIAVCKAQGLTSQCFFLKEKDIVQNEARDRKIKTIPLSLSFFFVLTKRDREKGFFLFQKKEKGRKR